MARAAILPALVAGLLTVVPAGAGTIELAPVPVTEFKAVYGRVEARETIPARARIGGLVVELGVSEGDTVSAGQRIAVVQDDKIAFQIAAVDARISALRAQLETAETELARGQALVERGTATVQRLDQLRTSVDVIRDQILATEAERAVLAQQRTEGEVLAPSDGRVLTVPVTRGAVIMAGEPVATIGGGGFFLRLAIPERHAGQLDEGDAIRITANGIAAPGRLAKIYPQIANGRVIADVEVEGLDTSFVDARVLVEVPIGVREALLVPQAAVSTRSGIDFVTIRTGDGTVERAVVPGEAMARDGTAMIEILTGLAPGDKVVTP
jgi:RND family efflux transporter MFP subunit